MIAGVPDEIRTLTPRSTNPEHIYLVAMLYMLYCRPRAVEPMMMMMMILIMLQ